jgi:nucleolar protein 4
LCDIFKGADLFLDIAHVLFNSPKTAQEAVTKLHAHVFKGALLSVTLKKRLDGLAKPTKAKNSKTSATAKNAIVPSRANRLIVRNLPFDITEQDLRAVFLPYGPIHSIHIPTKEAETKEEGTSSEIVHRAKGYAFVWMLSKKDAEKALESVNGMKVRAGLADGLVRHKQLKKKLRREEAKQKQREKQRKARGKDGEIKDEEVGAQDLDNNRDANEQVDEEDEEEDPSERVIAVDWALSKDKWEEAKAKLQSEEPKNMDEAGEGLSDVESDNEDADHSHIGVHDSDDSSDSDNSGSEDSDNMDLDENETKPAKPQLPQTDTGTTLFVRNVPFEATEDELRAM